MEIGIVGKPNVGKSTLFSALTLVDVPIANYPFTTIDGYVGVGYVRVKCVCKELKVNDNPKNSLCIDGNRYVPIKIIDTAGLVPNAWQGRGLGNHFLNKISTADALIQVIDTSGSTDIEGHITSPGSFDPVEEIKFLKIELVRWIYSILLKHWDSIKKMILINKVNPIEALYGKLSGLKFSKEVISITYRQYEDKCGFLSKWNEECILKFVEDILMKGKPIVIAANKIDFKVSKNNLERIQSEGFNVVPISALSELILRKLASNNLVKYKSGDNDFKIIDLSRLSKKQIGALEKIRKLVFEKYGSTGVQTLLNHVVFDVLNYITVFPVRDPNKLADKNGNVLPDAYLIPNNISLKDFASTIHSELGEKFLYGIDAKRKIRVKGDYILKDRDVISIVSSL